ncbi:general secretion pathway protein I [Syntrophus gentianae]|uniref:General secretion pathway protein I n=2 Tax=Syntrophus gentianae TaxID=43775 RepID=A0A1H7Z370_9BACT|nr:general secretion pathway protein I [Syntrophus gentianae]
MKIRRKAVQPMKNNERNQGGFTLIEIMIALTVLALVVAAVAQALAQSLALAHRIKEETTLSLLAQSKMAEIESAKEMPLSDRGNFTGDYSQYAWQVTVSEIDFATLQKVEVTVRNTLSDKSAGYCLSSFQYRDEKS